MGILIIFVDGVGLGGSNADLNPLAAAPMPTLRRLLGGYPLTEAAARVAEFPSGALLLPIDATLDVDGLPQSGTGQASLWSGINVAARLGRHSGPYAPPLARELLQQHNLFAAAQSVAAPVAFANAYPPRYLDRLSRGTARQSVTALAAHLAGLPLRGPVELKIGTALSAFITNEMWEGRLGVPGLPVISAPEAGANLARLTQQYGLVVFEYFATDMAGHRAEGDFIQDVLQRLDGLLDGVLATLNSATDLLLLVSDHGNLEDASTTDHTLNPVPGLLWGHKAYTIATRLASLTDVMPAVLEWLRKATYSV